MMTLTERHQLQYQIIDYEEQFNNAKIQMKKDNKYNKANLDRIEAKLNELKKIAEEAK